jgi:hypothetical protein
VSAPQSSDAEQRDELRVVGEADDQGLLTVEAAELDLHAVSPSLMVTRNDATSS